MWRRSASRPHAPALGFGSELGRRYAACIRGPVHAASHGVHARLAWGIARARGLARQVGSIIWAARMGEGGRGAYLPGTHLVVPPWGDGVL